MDEVEYQKKKRKRLCRYLQAKHGVKYTAALRMLEAMSSSEVDALVQEMKES